MKIAIDAMGGDHAPSEIVAGTLDAASELKDITCILVGNEDKIKTEIAKFAGNAPSNVVVEHASQVVEMHEHPVEALRQKRQSSIVKSIKLVRDGGADAAISAGNTGAMVAAGMFILGNLEGVKRAGIAVPLPSEKGRTTLIDVGANPNCKLINFLQYAVMASIYSKTLFNNVESPTIGLLNIGEESEKGNSLSREVYKHFKESSLNFVGNVEGHELFTGKCDVVVCDGFVGNTILKTSEGLASFIVKQFASKLNGDRSKDMAEFSDRLDYSAYGGAPLLGVKGIVLICHGRSHAKAIKNAIKAACNLVHKKLNDSIVTELKKLSWWGRLTEWFTAK